MSVRDRTWWCGALLATVALATTACHSSTGSANAPVNDPDYGSLSFPPSANGALIVPETEEGDISPNATPKFGSSGQTILAVDPGACTTSSGDVYMNHFMTLDENIGPQSVNNNVRLSVLKSVRTVKRWSDLTGGGILALPGLSPGMSLDAQVASNHQYLAGLVCRTDGTLATSFGQTVYSIDENPNSTSRKSNSMTPLAGSGTIRDVMAPVPESMPSASALTAHTAPIGERRDGSLIVIDGPVVWSLHGGTLNRIYQWPGKATENAHTPLGMVGAVTADDTAYIAPETSPGVSVLGDVVGIRADGTTTGLDLPDSLPGGSAPAKSLDVYGLIADGGNGLYARVGQGVSGPQYVLHIRRGQVDVVAASAGGAQAQFLQRPQDAEKPFNALSLPMFLPVTMSVQSGMLVLSDSLSFGVVYIRLP
jgi:hypothetical protein